MKDELFFKRVKIFGRLLLIIGVAAFLWSLTKEYIESDELEIIYWIIITSLGSGIFLLIYAQRRHKSIWNDLTFGEQAEILAQDLASGKREWCLNEFRDKVNDKMSYYFAPLKKNNLNEFGRARHIETDRKHIDKMINTGELANIEMAKLIIQYFDVLQTDI
ncbi:MAG: hypothetical protein WC467_02330 [Patescibacteria group bacterium]